MEQDKERLRTDIRELGRRALREVWRRHRRGEELPAEAARLARILAAHPEFAWAWERGPDAAGEEVTDDAVNPYLHVQIHLMVEEQIAGESPPEVFEALQALEAAGRSRHQAIHEVGKVLTLELHAALRQRRPFDSAAYVRALVRIRNGHNLRADSR